ncbi:T9SS type A sorting domain-containing protein, partial [candidate division KSB1 bacterium]|nr:T9SS type A sorting domain-containing protein [candidate division KSB1 bacterium]
FSGNTIEDPILGGIGRDSQGGLDPRPSTQGPAAATTNLPANPFFTQATYKGAFDPNSAALWTDKWTALYSMGITGEGTAVEDRFVDTEVIPDAFILAQNYPNPFNPVTTLSYALPTTAQVKLVVYNQIGQEIETLVNGVQTAGQHKVTWNAMDLPSGLYFYQLNAGNQIFIKKMMLIK